MSMQRLSVRKSRCQYRKYVLAARAALTAKHDTLVRRAPAGKGPPTASRQKKLVVASRGPYASILPVYQQRDWGPGMVKCVGPTRCLMRPCSQQSTERQTRPLPTTNLSTVILPCTVTLSFLEIFNKSLFFYLNTNVNIKCCTVCANRSGIIAAASL